MSSDVLVASDASDTRNLGRTQNRDFTRSRDFTKYRELTQQGAQRNQAATIATNWLDREAFVEVTPGGETLKVSYAHFLDRVLSRAQELRELLAGQYSLRSNASNASNASNTNHYSQSITGVRVGILGKNSVAWMADFYALQLIGAVPVPLSYKFPTPALEHVLGDANIGLVLLSNDYLPQLEALSAARRSQLNIQKLGGSPNLDAAQVEGDSGSQGPDASAQLQGLLEAPSEDDYAMILYTSGSTGNPKGVALNHASHVWVMDTIKVDREQRFTVEVAAPLYHMNALARSQKALASGETIVLLTEFDAATYVDAIDQFDVNELTGVPPMFALLETHLANANTGHPTVKHVNMASAPAGDALFDTMAQAFPAARVTIGYGTTESGPVAFYPPEDQDVPVGAVGVPHPAVQVRLVDPATGTEQADFGVLQIKTGAHFSEYLNKPASEKPITTDGFYHTKDLFRLESGYYVFAGREDDMFNSGAENVYPAAVEEVLLQHLSVKEAVVVPVPDLVKTWKPVAFITLTEQNSQTNQNSQIAQAAQTTLREGARSAGNTDEFLRDSIVEAPGIEHELKQHTLAHMEPFAHPRRIWVLAAMPLAATNKVDRKALAQLAAKLV